MDMLLIGYVCWVTRGKLLRNFEFSCEFVQGVKDAYGQVVSGSCFVLSLWFDYCYWIYINTKFDDTRTLAHIGQFLLPAFFILCLRYKLLSEAGVFRTAHLYKYSAAPTISILFVNVLTVCYFKIVVAYLLCCLCCFI